MSHLYINYHTFFSDSHLSRVFKGPSPDLVRSQLRSIKCYLRPAGSLLECLDSQEVVFSVTVDDGSKSFLEALPMFVEEGVHISVAVVGVSALHKELLLANKVHLLRRELGEEELWKRLCQVFPLDFSEENWRWPPGFSSSTLYLYDVPLTRRLKMALNFQLTHEQATSFVDPLFTSLFGSQVDMCKALYMGIEDLRRVKPYVDIMYHGYTHRLWALLHDSDHQKELRVPNQIAELLSENYVLSIPFGLPGTFQPSRVERDAGAAIGAFTMARRLGYERNHNGFWWLHRLDQADIFDSQGEVRVQVLEGLLNRHIKDV